MSDKTLSGLTDGGPIQSGDMTYIVRGGNSRKLDLRAAIVSTFTDSGDIDFTDTGAGVRGSIKPGILGYVTPQQYGAVGDGSADDYAAFVLAYNAAIAAGHKTIFLPPGTYDLATTFSIVDENVTLFGLARRNTTIRRRAGATLTSLVHVGIAASSTRMREITVSGITFDGNSGCSDAVLKLWNPVRCDIINVKCETGAADGLKSETSTDAANALRNCYIDIECQSNTGNGMHFIGERESRFDVLFAGDNTADGIIFRAFEFVSGTLTETSQCVIGQLSVDDNGSDGVVFDGTEKFTVGAILSTQNAGWGVKFLSTDVSVSGNATNNCNIGVIETRGNQTGGLRVGDQANMNGAQFGSVKIVGGGAVAGEEGIHLEGVANVQFGIVTISLVAGTAINILEGNPLGAGTTQSGNISFGDVRLNSNGNASATSHGIFIQDTTSEVVIGSLISGNSQTTGSNYEVSLESGVADVVIGNSSITSNSGSNGVSAPTARQLMFVGRRELEGVELSEDHFAFTLSGVLRPSQITADQNNYNPTGLETASVLFLNSDASRTITGLAGGRDGRVIVIHNDGSNDVVLADESGSSTAANRFALTAALTIAADAVALLQYDGTDARWRAVSGGGGSGTIGGSTGTADNRLLRADGTGGATVQASHIAITDTGDVTGVQAFTADGLITAAGGQIAFPASQNASAGANTLDDYEEGTWTFTITAATPGDLSVTYTLQDGTYTKIGNVVLAIGRVQTATFTHSTASGQGRLQTLPFTASTNNCTGAMNWQRISKATYTDIVAQTQATTYCRMRASGSGVDASDVAITEMTSGVTHIYAFAVTYQV